MKDNIQDTDGLIRGISKVTQLVRGAYGASGGNVIVESPLYPFFMVTNDGKTMVDPIRLTDPVENIGASIIKEAGDKADKDSREGRKTTMILVEEILLNSQGLADDPMKIKRSLDEALPSIQESLDEQKIHINVDNVHQVATISSESDEIGSIVGSIYKELGKEVIIEVDSSGLPTTFYDITDGVRLRGAKMLGYYSLTEPTKAVYKKPSILISREKIVSTDQLEPIMAKLIERGVNSLVIFCDDIDMTVASKLAKTHLDGGFKTLLIKAPILWKDWVFQDFALMTGATPVDIKNGKTFKNLSIPDLGACGQIIASAEEVRVIGIKDLTDHVKALNESPDDQMKLRATWLQTKVATIRVGASSESELNYKTKKTRDACSASYQALQDGGVRGGGVALYKAIDSLPNTVGGEILREALKGPLKQILKNGDKDYDLLYTMDELIEKIPENVIDASMVVKNAIRNAISIAGTVLTARGLVVVPEDIRKMITEAQMKASPIK